MAFSRNTAKFYKEFQTPAGLLRIEMIPADDNTIGTLVEAEFPDFVFEDNLVDSISGGFENQLKIGVPESLELTLKIDINNLTGDFIDVRDWILDNAVQKNVVWLAESYVGSVVTTNRWTVLLDGNKVFEGFQSAEAIPFDETIDFSGAVSRSTVEIKVFDVVRSVIVSADMSGLDFDDFTVDGPAILASVFVDCTNGTDRVFCDTFTKTGYGNSSPTRNQTIAKMLPDSTVWERFSACLLVAFSAQYRNPLPTAYNIIENYRDEWRFKDSTGTNFTQTELYDNLYLVAEDIDPETDEATNIFQDGGVLGFDNARDVIHYVCEQFLQSVRFIADRDSATPLTCEFEPINYKTGFSAYDITTADIVNEPQPVVKFNDKTLTLSAQSFTNVGGDDIEEQRQREAGTILNQKSYEADTVIDNLPVRCETDDFAYLGSDDTTPPSVESYVLAKTKHPGLFFQKITTGQLSDAYVKPLNIVQYLDLFAGGGLSATYGGAVTPPTIWDRAIDQTDRNNLFSYVRSLQLQDGFSLAWTDIILQMWGTGANFAILDITLNLNGFFAGVGYNLTESLGQKVTFNHGSDLVPPDGWIVEIRGVDFLRDTIDVSILLSKGGKA